MGLRQFQGPDLLKSRRFFTRAWAGGNGFWSLMCRCWRDMKCPCTLRMMGQTDPYGGAEERGWERKRLAGGMVEEKGHREVWGGDLIEKVTSSSLSFILSISSMGLY